MAKFNFRQEVTQYDVDQAIKLMDFSLKTLETISEPSKRVRRQQEDSHQDQMSKVIGDIRTLFRQEGVQQLNQAEIVAKLMKVNPGRYGNRGITKDNILETLNNYKKLSVIFVDDSGNVVFL